MVGDDTSRAVTLEVEQELDDLAARRLAQQNLTAAGTPTGIKGTLGVIVTATQVGKIPLAQAIDLVKALKDRPDIWLAPALCEAVIRTLQKLG